MATDLKDSPEATTQGQPAPTEPAKSAPAAAEPARTPTEPTTIPQGYVPQKDLDELKTAFGRQGNELGDLRKALAERDALAQHWQTTAQRFAGLAQEREDPEVAAYSQYQKVMADNPYDAPAIAEAQRVWLDNRDAKRERRMLEQTLRASQLQSELPRAAEMLGVSDLNAASSMLANVPQTLTPSELALIQLNRNGKLQNYVEAQAKARKDAAENAARLQSIDPGGGRSVPGQNTQGRYKVIDWEDWVTLNDEAKARFRGMAEPIHIKNAPKGFDANKD